MRNLAAILNRVVADEIIAVNPLSKIISEDKPKAMLSGHRALDLDTVRLPDKTPCKERLSLRLLRKTSIQRYSKPRLV